MCPGYLLFKVSLNIPGSDREGTNNGNHYAGGTKQQWQKHAFDCTEDDYP
ncbi:hypothetical protein ES703_75537 [subsurface metagenome]